MRKSWKQIFYGNYTDDVTLLGTVASMGLGVVDLDILGDMRDVWYDITHPEGTWESVGRGAADTIALLPGLTGTVKYGDEAFELVQGAVKGLKYSDGVADSVKNVDNAVKTSRKQAFRQAKEATGIPKSAQYKKHKFIYDSSSENRIVYEFDVDGELKYIIEHPFDKLGRGPHFHGADASKGNPFNKGRYNQYDGHFPEDFDGFN